MKKMILGCCLLLLCTGEAAYQVYDVKLTLNTTKSVQISLPYPLSEWFGTIPFRKKSKETLSGMLVCWGSDWLCEPSLMYLRSSETGRIYRSGGSLDIWWPVYNRLSPKDSAVEGAWNLRLNDGATSYTVSGAGVGKSKLIKYKRWWSRGTYSLLAADALKGNLAGYKNTASPHGVTIDGTASMGTSSTAVYGTWQIKFNKKYSDVIYRLSTMGNAEYSIGEASGAVCSDDGASDDGRELDVAEIAAALGLL